MTASEPGWRPRSPPSKWRQPWQRPPSGAVEPLAERAARSTQDQGCVQRGTWRAGGKGAPLGESVLVCRAGRLLPPCLTHLHPARLCSCPAPAGSQGVGRAQAPHCRQCQPRSKRAAEAGAALNKPGSVFIGRRVWFVWGWRGETQLPIPRCSRGNRAPGGDKGEASIRQGSGRRGDLGVFSADTLRNTAEPPSAVGRGCPPEPLVLLQGPAAPSSSTCPWERFYSGSPPVCPPGSPSGRLLPPAPAGRCHRHLMAPRGSRPAPGGTPPCPAPVPAATW